MEHKNYIKTITNVDYLFVKISVLYLNGKQKNAGTPNPLLCCASWWHSCDRPLKLKEGSPQQGSQVWMRHWRITKRMLDGYLFLFRSSTTFAANIPRLQKMSATLDMLNSTVCRLALREKHYSYYESLWGCLKSCSGISYWLVHSSPLYNVLSLGLCEIAAGLFSVFILKTD